MFNEDVVFLRHLSVPCCTTYFYLNRAPGGTDFLKIKESPNSFLKQEHICKGSAPDYLPVTITCDDLLVDQPQAGADVTWGYKGLMEVDHDPNPNPFVACAPSTCTGTSEPSTDPPASMTRTALVPPENQPLSKQKPCLRCHHYDADDPKFTTPYVFKHCSEMEVGKTDKVHWPHANTGTCSTIYQYQTPFIDSVFCNLSHEAFTEMTPQELADNVGVQGQVFTIVNDEDWGMIVNINDSKPMGVDLTICTRSSTGDKFDIILCSPVTPVTWQVDRKYHLISASSFDAMCTEMELQVSNMSSQVKLMGSHDLVADEYAANNQVYLGTDTESSGFAAVNM